MMLMYPLIFVSYQVRHIEYTINFTPVLCNTHRCVTTFEPVQMRAFEHEIAGFPRIVTLAPLAHPALVIRLADLLQDALVRFERAIPGSCDSW
jgi:hypothetical protein